MTELPDNNPKTRAGGANKVPLHLVPATAVAHMARAVGDGGTKYQPYNWRAEPISASVYYGAARRHIDAWWEGEDHARDSGVHHLAHAMACLAMILDTMERPGCLNDNRPPASDYTGLLDRLAGRLPALKERPETRYDLHDIPRPIPVAEEIVLEQPLRHEELSQDAQLVRIRWRDPLRDWMWYWLNTENSADGQRMFDLWPAADPDSDAQPPDRSPFWACADEIEWMTRVRPAGAAQIYRAR